MDLSSLDLRALPSKPLELLHPGTGEKTGVMVSCLCFDSDAVEAAAREVRQAALAGDKPDPAELLRKRRVAMARASIVGVDGGSGDTATVEALRALVEKPGFVLSVEQIEAFVGNRASFFKSAETL